MEDEEVGDVDSQGELRPWWTGGRDQDGDHPSLQWPTKLAV